MIKFENNNITAITYNDYEIVKVYGECSQNPIWEKQEPPTPPQPTGMKWGFTDMSGGTHSYPCDSSSTLTRDNIADALDGLFVDPALDNYYIHSAWVGECVTTLGANVFDAFFDCSAITLHNGITTIGHDAFDATDIREITIPSATTVIPDHMCNGCENLSSVTFHDGITSIGKNAFNDCLSLTSITIPSSVTYIDDSAFHIAYKPADQRAVNALANRVVIMQSATPPTIAYANVFGDNSRATYTIYVPAQSLEAYRTATNWEYIAARIQPIT